jgi:FlaA1/EpsC-like NDP-sugar epimerase
MSNIFLFKELRQNLRWIVLLFDIFAAAFSVLVAFVVIFTKTLFTEHFDILVKTVVLVVLVRSLFYFAGRTYAGIIRYTSTKDTFRLKIYLL